MASKLHTTFALNSYPQLLCTSTIYYINAGNCCPIMSHQRKRPPLLNIKVPSGIHPHQAHARNDSRPSQTLSKPYAPKHEPLGVKVSRSNDIAPERQLVQLRIRDIVRSVQADDSRQERPGTKGARAQRSHRASTSAVYLLGWLQGRVRLQRITCCDEGDLQKTRERSRVSGELCSSLFKGGGARARRELSCWDFEKDWGGKGFGYGDDVRKRAISADSQGLQGDSPEETLVRIDRAVNGDSVSR